MTCPLINCPLVKHSLIKQLNRVDEMYNGEKYFYEISDTTIFKKNLKSGVKNNLNQMSILFCVYCEIFSMKCLFMKHPIEHRNTILLSSAH